MMTASPDSHLVILVEFGKLSPEQRMFVDLHHLRAVGEARTLPESDGYLAAFWLRDGQAADDVYDDVRGWALGHALPIRGRRA
jgi:hypothetical protein